MVTHGNGIKVNISKSIWDLGAVNRVSNSPALLAWKKTMSVFPESNFNLKQLRCIVFYLRFFLYALLHFYIFIICPFQWDLLYSVGRNYIKLQILNISIVMIFQESTERTSKATLNFIEMVEKRTPIFLKTNFTTDIWNTKTVGCLATSHTCLFQQHLTFVFVNIFIQILLLRCFD